jgi:hypothetical protein
MLRRYGNTEAPYIYTESRRSLLLGRGLTILDYVE